MILLVRKGMTECLLPSILNSNKMVKHEGKCKIWNVACLYFQVQPKINYSINIKAKFDKEIGKEDPKIVNLLCTTLMF